MINTGSRAKRLRDKILEEAASAAEKLEEQARRTIDHEFKQGKTSA
ncbi:MAG: hypothetical protein R2860_08350 [Desulfobacterales bacterium]